MEKRGVYRLPAGYRRAFGPLEILKPEPSVKLASAFPGLSLASDSIKVSLVDSQQVWSNDPNEGFWLLLEAPGARFIWRSARKSTGISEFLLTGRLFSTGATCDVYANWLHPARYRVLVYRSGPKPRLVATDLYFNGQRTLTEDWLD